MASAAALLCSSVRPVKSSSACGSWTVDSTLLCDRPLMLPHCQIIDRNKRRALVRRKADTIL
jgi:hypothetical protein